MSYATFPQNGLTLETTVVVKAEYLADTHTISVTVDGKPFHDMPRLMIDALYHRAMDTLLKLCRQLVNECNCDPYEVDQLKTAAAAKFA